MQQLARMAAALVRIAAALVTAWLIGPAAHAATLDDVFGFIPPIGAGRYPVGCSNVEQDFLRAAGDPVAYWEGRGSGGTGYVTDLLVDPAHAVVTGVTLPDDRDLYGDFRNRTLTFLSLVCYPTTAGNPYGDYALANGRVVPRMQRGGQPPIFADDRARFPLLLFSHGFGGSPLSSDYIEALKLLASHGYVVIAPFHADSRIVDVRIDSFDDLLQAILDFGDYTAMQAIRPRTMSAALDAVLADQNFATRIDPARIGGFGASLGGESLLLMRGAQLTISVGLSSKSVIDDTRLGAAVGYVPYFGQPFFPAFGRDQHGLDDVSLPYLAISGSEDTMAPAGTAATGMLRLPGVRQFVLLAGVAHGFDVRSSADIFTWSLEFLSGYAALDTVARATSARMVRVTGGGDDALLLDKAEPLPPGPGEALIVEYYAPALDHYFVTGYANEIAILDAGVLVPGWQRTGYTFKAYAPATAAGVPACRFFGRPGIGPNTHFYTVFANECQSLMNQNAWIFEGLVFRVEQPDAIGACPADRVPVVRVYNNGKGGEANHRYLTSHSEATAMVLQGWLIEGPVFCSLP